MSKTLFALAAGVQSGQIGIMITHPVERPDLAPDCKFILAFKPLPECAPAAAIQSKKVTSS